MHALKATNLNVRTPRAWVSFRSQQARLVR